MPQAGTPPARPYTTNIADHIVGIFGGPNGPGSGFFVAAEGIIATTRYLTAGSERLTVELQPGRQVSAHLVRAYPELDLALLRVEFAPSTSLPITPLPRVPDDTPLLAAPYQRGLVSGRQRATKRVLAAHWIPTSFDRWEDAGGAPIFDQQYYLVGMATRNTARNSGHYFALHIAAIRAQVDEFLALSRAENRAYCPTCGAASKAGVMGFFYCETCGATLPNARHTARYPLPQAEALYETGRVRCTRCGAHVGFHQGRCLRCGQPPATSALA
jgi:ribosomal protein L37AE/L43A